MVCCIDGDMGDCLTVLVISGDNEDPKENVPKEDNLKDVPLVELCCDVTAEVVDV